MDMALEEVNQGPQCTLQSSVCKVLARLVGISKELLEFDLVRSK